jgi:hypothetical protein
VNSKVLISPVLAVAAFVLVGPVISAPQMSVVAKRYEVSFPPNSDKVPSQATGSSELAGIIDLLVHQGQRRELTFVMAGAVSKACMEWPNCPERMLLMHRAEHIVDALRNLWPAAVERGAFERLRWEAVPAISLEHDQDRVRVLLRLKSSPARDDCLARLEVLDPNLPGTVENPDRAQWIQMPADQLITISSSARLRAYQAPQRPQSFEVWLKAAGQSKPLQPQLDKELGENTFVVGGSDSSFSITFRLSGDASTSVRELVQREGIQSRMGEIVAGFPTTAPGNPPSGPCSFGFHRWNR